MQRQIILLISQLMTERARQERVAEVAAEDVGSRNMCRNRVLVTYLRINAHKLFFFM